MMFTFEEGGDTEGVFWGTGSSFLAVAGGRGCLDMGVGDIK